MEQSQDGEFSDAYEAIFTALAHPARRRILMSLNFAGGGLSAGRIAGLFGHAWPTTTRHLQTLEAAGLIRHRQEGRRRIYEIASHRLAVAQDWLAWFQRDPITGQEKSDDAGNGSTAISNEYRSRRSR